MNEWQPIETAANDGERVLLYDEKDPDKIFIGFKSNRGWLNTDPQCGGYYTVDPTHWMPLPEAPSQN